MVCVRDNEALILRRAWPTSGHCAMREDLREESADLSRYFVNFIIFCRCPVQNTINMVFRDTGIDCINFYGN